jgi:acetolactate synthase small subunit
VARDHLDLWRDPTHRRTAVRHTHHLELTVADMPLVLDRIVSLCRARQCAIVALRFEAADRHRPGRVHATIEADARRARLAARRLLALPGVTAVAHAGGERVEVHSGAVADRTDGAPARTYGGA